MAGALKFAVCTFLLFGGIYIVWNLFWRPTFVLIDILNRFFWGRSSPLGLIVAIALMAGLTWKLFGRPKSSSESGKQNNSHSPAPPLARPQSHETAHSEKTPSVIDQVISAGVNSSGKKAALGLYKNGIQFAKQRRFEEAADAFEDAIALNPGWKEAHYRLGLARKQLCLWDQTADAFEDVLDLDDGYAEAYFHMGYCLYQMGDLGAAQLECRVLEAMDEHLAKKLCMYINMCEARNNASSNDDDFEDDSEDEED